MRPATLSSVVRTLSEKRDRAEYGENDHCQNYTVLRHRLSLLTLAQRIRSDVHEGNEPHHLIPSHESSARRVPCPPIRVGSRVIPPSRRAVDPSCRYFGLPGVRARPDCH